jgi:diguanylate cyclase (GGDEF)-like protein
VRRRPTAVPPLLQRVDEAYVMATSVVGGLACILGAFEPTAVWWLRWVLLWLMVGVAAADARNRASGRIDHRALGPYEGPVLWLVLSLAIARSAGIAELEALPVGLAGFLFATTPSKVRTPALAAVLLLEVGLAASGRMSGGLFMVHLGLYGLSCFAFSRLGSYQRWMVERAQAKARAVADAETRTRAEDFGVHTRQAEALPRMPSLEEHTAGPAGSRQALDFVEQSITLQLELLRTSLELNTAVVLWHNRDLAELHLRGISTVRDDVRQGPFAPGVGIPATILREEVREMQVAPVRAGLAMLPYYSEGAPVGGLFAVAIPHRVGATDVQDTGVDGVLCVDRERTERFTDAERTVVRQTARKIAMDVACGRVLKQSEHDRATMSRFVVVLRELNAQLGLEGVARAASKAVKTLFSVDLVAVSELEGDILRIIHADGINADRFQGLQFTRDEGLTGQAVSKRVVLPHGGEYRGVQPIFTASDRLGDLHSLLVIPLCPPDGDPDVPVVGALTVGSREANLFSPQQQKVLELIATTLATKLDLARSHEKLRDLATHDGLTSLALRRVFDERIESMLQRAERTEGRMALMLMDIDHFKRLNDNYGHTFGDEVLRQVAAVIGRAVRKVDLAARYGGEEFAVLLEDANEEGAVQLAERIRRDVEALVFDSEGRPVNVTLSLGIAAFPRDGGMPKELTDNADKALYKAKSDGRNRTVSFSQVVVEVPATPAVPTP